MKKLTALLTALALILGLCACSLSAAATWQEQCDLGVRYLSEGKYEEAILAFNAAIEIDPRRADAYIGLADAYEAQGNTEQARQVLEDALVAVSDPDTIRSRLVDLEGSAVSESTSGMTLEPTREPMPGTTAEPSQGPASGTMPAPSAGGSQAANTPEVTVTATGIRADGVINYDGYGSLRINGNWWDMENATPAQLAVIDRSGALIFPYREDTVGNYFNGDARFYYSDGIVSLTLNGIHSFGGVPQYFQLNGTPAFVLGKTENEYTDADGKTYHESTSYNYGAPMRDGYAVIIGRTYSYWTMPGFAGGNDYVYKTMIIDRNGEVTCELPQEFNEDIALGAGGIDTKMSLGWCGEGLFPFFENSYDFVDGNNFTYISEGKGYMDPTGKTVIDLEGRGFYGLGTFNDGLAYVRDS